MRIFQEFKTFAMRGNAIDLAVGIVVGAAFTSIVNSLVKDMINPLLGMILGGLDFSNFFIVLKGMPVATLKEATDTGAVTWNYGLFLNSVINFVIVAFALFVVVRQLNRLTAPRTAPPPAVPPPPPEDVVLLREIRDLLKDHR